MPELALIIPAYNEEKNIKSTLASWAKVLEPLEIDYVIHVYNDGSSDKTALAVSEMTGQNKRVVLHDQKNSGHGPTILRGYLENSQAEWLFQADSDNEIDPGSFRLLWEQRKGYDFILGRRAGRNSAFARKIVSLVSRITVWALYSRKIFDVNSPFRLMRSAGFRGLFEMIPRGTFAPNLIITGFAGLKGMRTLEIPVPYSDRTFGKTSLGNIRALASSAARSLKETILFRFSGLRPLKDE